MKAYGYIRCSGLSQGDGDGPERQRMAIIAYCGMNEIEIAGWFDEFHTGTDLEGRPEFRKMREAMVSNGIRIVVVEKMDRLARSIMVQETIIGDFKNNGITLKSATLGEDDLCGDDPTRVLIRQILACFFDYERKMIVSKLKAARERIKEQGRAPGAKNYSPDPALNKNAEGRKPYGQKPGEAEPLRMILAWHRANVACGSIAANLNSAGIPSRRGKSWRASVVAKILARERQKAA